jgi:hypothetical protein
VTGPFEVPVLGPAGEVDTWEFTGSETADVCTLTATAPAGGTWSGEGADWFDALRAVRVALDADGLLPLCAGARLNAGSSGMLADTTRGTHVYLLEPRRTPRKPVWIFAPAGPDEVASVADQEAFFERWLSAPPRRNLLEPVAGLLREVWLRVRYR